LEVSENLEGLKDKHYPAITTFAYAFEGVGMDWP
jgi:hypothetical protein